MNEFPQEIINMIVGESEDEDDLVSCRFVNKKWAFAAAYGLFSKVVLWADDVSFERARAIAGHPAYGKLVKELHLDLSFIPPICDEEDWQEVVKLQNKVPKVWGPHNDIIDAPQSLAQHYRRFRTLHSRQAKFEELSLKECLGRFRDVNSSLPNIVQIYIHNRYFRRRQTLSCQSVEFLTLLRPRTAKDIWEGPWSEYYDKTGFLLDVFAGYMVKACLIVCLGHSRGRDCHLHFRGFNLDDIDMVTQGEPCLGGSTADILEMFITFTPSEEEEEEDYDVIHEAPPISWSRQFIKFFTLTCGRLRKLCLEFIGPEFFAAVEEYESRFPQLYKLCLKDVEMSPESFKILDGSKFPSLQRLEIHSGVVDLDERSWPETWEWLSAHHGQFQVVFSGTLQDRVCAWRIEDQHLGHTRPCGCLLERIEDYANGIGSCPIPLADDGQPIRTTMLLRELSDISIKVDAD